MSKAKGLWAIWDNHAKVFVGSPVHLYDERDDAERYASRLNHNHTGTHETGHTFDVAEIKFD